MGAQQPTQRINILLARLDLSKSSKVSVGVEGSVRRSTLLTSTSPTMSNPLINLPSECNIRPSQNALQPQKETQVQAACNSTHAFRHALSQDCGQRLQAAGNKCQMVQSISSPCRQLKVLFARKVNSNTRVTSKEGCSGVWMSVLRHMVQRQLDMFGRRAAPRNETWQTMLLQRHPSRASHALTNLGRDQMRRPALRTHAEACEWNAGGQPTGSERVRLLLALAPANYCNM